jgi:hypothetical protein
MNGVQVIAIAILPIDQLMEEVQESLHKQLKAHQQRYSRKRSKISTNTDLIHSLLVSTDPLISNLWHLSRKCTRISKDILQLTSLPVHRPCESSDLEQGLEAAKMRGSVLSFVGVCVNRGCMWKECRAQLLAKYFPYFVCENLIRDLTVFNFHKKALCPCVLILTMYSRPPSFLSMTQPSSN